VSEIIQFDATVQKVQTLVDFGLRVTLDLPETAIISAAQLMAAKREGLILHVSIEPEKQVKSVNDEHGQISTRAIRKSVRATA
jgi:hypothetical protein